LLGCVGLVELEVYLNAQVEIPMGMCFSAKGNRKYCPAIYVMNKIDQITIEELDIIAEAL